MLYRQINRDCKAPQCCLRYQPLCLSQWNFNGKVSTSIKPPDRDTDHRIHPSPIMAIQC